MQFASTTEHLPVRLEISGSPGKITSLPEVNDILKTVGVHLSEIDATPEEAIPLLKESATRTLTLEERNQILSHFPLDRAEVKRHREELGGRICDIKDGGEMATEEVCSGAPYPKVFSICGGKMAVDKWEGGRAYAGFKYGKLHVNVAPSTDHQLGEAKHVSVDEFTTIPAGGPYMTYFAMKNGQVARLTMGRVTPGKVGWRLSYPGITPHGGLFTESVNSGDIVSIQHVVGPRGWYMCYSGSLTGIDEIPNPWVDFSGEVPISRSSEQAHAIAGAAAAAKHD